MKKHIEYKTSGTCSRMVVVDVEDGVITDCRFIGGCAGNTQGVAALVIGMRAEDAIAKMDKRRANYYNYHSGEKWGKATNYHLSVNSGHIGIDNTVDCIKAFIDSIPE